MNKLITYDKIMNCNPDYDFQEIGMPTNYEDTVINFINEYRYKIKDLDDIVCIVEELSIFNDKQYQYFALGYSKIIETYLNISISKMQNKQIDLIIDILKTK